MRVEEKIVILIILFTLIPFSIYYSRKILLTNFNWFRVPEPHELYFLSYDKEAKDYLEFEIFSSEDLTCQMTFCGERKDISLKEGITKFDLKTDRCKNLNNLLNISCGKTYILFYFNRSDGLNEKKVRLNYLSLERKDGIFELRVGGIYNFSTSSFVPIQIFLDENKLYSFIYFFEKGNKTFEVSEKIELPRGSKLKVRILDEEAEILVEPKERRIQSELFALLFLSILLTKILSKRFKMDLLESFLVLFSLVTILFIFQFQLHDNFGIHKFFLLTLSPILIFLSVKLKEKKKIGFRKKVKVESIVFSLIFTAYVSVLKFLIGPFDVWWPYYSRNIQNTFLHKTTFFVDELSYLGRDFVYPPAFFEFGAQITRLLQADSFYSIQIPLHIFIVFIFSITSYLVFFRLKERRERIVASLCLTSLVFTFLTAVSGTLHTFFFALVNMSVIFFLIGDVFKLISIFLLAVAISTHPISLPMFISFILLLRKPERKNLFEIVKMSGFSILISSIFYIPILLRYGFPYEIVPRRWGYFITFGVPGLFFDYQYLLPLAVSGILIGLWKKKIFKSLLLFVLISANVYVSYRINVIFSIFLSFFVVEILGEYLKNDVIFCLIFFPLLLNFILSSIIYSGVKDWCVWGSINEMCISAMEFLNRYISTKESVAINPEYAHLETYMGKKRVLADLYVEYAHKDKFLAEDRFYRELNVTYLRPYNISLAVLDDKSGIRRNLEGFDRIYDNSYFHIFRIA